MRSGIDRQGQERDVGSLRDGPSGQSEETDENHAPRVESRLERAFLLVSYLIRPVSNVSLTVFYF